jgi:hypothetical protein
MWAEEVQCQTLDPKCGPGNMLGSTSGPIVT